ncbi:MAG: DNA repair protein RadA, partial [Chlamydiae bacterium]|nr:DNA repair protein RadA [Chlamydiota bacterium]
MNKIITAPKTKIVWSCKECGHIQLKWTGSCPACQKWNTFTEEVSVVEKKSRFETKRGSSKPVRISEVEIGESKRLFTQMGELDRLFGGGVVGGSLILIGGEPGVGKSTLLLQMANSFAMQGLKVLYICG